MPQTLVDLSHEIRGKLTAIHLAASLINEGKAGPLTSEMAEISGMIVREAESLTVAIREVFSLVNPT
jgi:signal transduction histidine kinase